MSNVSRIMPFPKYYQVFKIATFVKLICTPEAVGWGVAQWGNGNISYNLVPTVQCTMGPLKLETIGIFKYFPQSIVKICRIFVILVAVQAWVPNSIEIFF